MQQPPLGHCCCDSDADRCCQRGAGIYALANFSGQGLLVFEGKPTNPIPQHGPLGEITGSTTGDQEVAHIALGVNGLADFALFAPLITRSRFVSVLFSGANVAGLFLGYGWCNAVSALTPDQRGV